MLLAVTRRRCARRTTQRVQIGVNSTKLACANDAYPGGSMFVTGSGREAAVKGMRAPGSALVVVRAFALILLCAFCCAIALPSAAQEEGGTSYINPFPPGDVYKLQAYGDPFAEGLLSGLNESLASDTRLQIQRRHRSLGGIARYDFEDELRSEEAGGREAMHIGVVMIGYNDR